MKYVLHDWIDATILDETTSVDRYYLSKNRNAVEYLKENRHLIDFEGLCFNRNPDVIPLLRECLSKKPTKLALGNLSRNRSADMMAFLEEPANEHLQDWGYLSANPSAMRLIDMYPAKINWRMILMNQKAEKLVTERVDHLQSMSTTEWKYLCHNKSRWAMALIEKNLDVFDAWDELSGNPFAIKLLERFPDRIDVKNLCLNPKAMHLLEKRIEHPDFSWELVSANPGAIDLLKRNLEKIDWIRLGMNPNAFEIFKDHHEKMHMGWHWLCRPWIFYAKYDYEAIRTCRDDLHKELMALYYHPSRMDFETCEVDATRSVFSSSKKRRFL